MKFSVLKLMFTIISISGLLSSCSKHPDKALPKKNGKWNAIITSHRTSTGGFDSTAVSNTIFTFIKDGTGSYIDITGVSQSFTWEYLKNSTKISYQKTNGYVIIFEVTVMERKKEQWHNVYSEIIALDTFNTDLTIDFTRAD